MRAYWEQLNSREQWGLGLAGLVLGLYLLYLLLLNPLQTAVAYRYQLLAEKAQDLQWMQSKLTEFKTQPKGPKADPSQLLSVLAKSIESARLKRFKPQLQQGSQQQAQIRFNSVPFNALMDWLWSLQKKQGISIQESQLEAGETTGLVAANLVLRF